MNLPILASKIRELLRNLVKNEWLVILLFVVFILRIPSLYEPHRYADEDIYLTLGNGLKNGMVFYRDIHDNKPPLIYVVAAIAGNVFWMRLILMGIHALGVVFFWLLSKELFKQRWAVVVSTSIFAVLSTLPRFEGNIANGENFMIVPAILGVYLFFRAVKQPKKYGSSKAFGVVGLMFAMAFLFKVPIVFDFMGLVVFWWLLAKPRLTWLQRIKRVFLPKIWIMVLGFVSPILLSVIYYAIKGAFEPYVRSALMQNIGYLSSWTGEQTSILGNHLVWKGLLVMGVIGGLIVLSRKLSKEMLILASWSVFSIYGALISNRPYPHYLLEPLVPMVLLGTLVLVLIVKRIRIWDTLVGAGVIGLMILLIINNGFWRYENTAYYKNFLDYALGNKDQAAYRNFFPGTERNYEIAEYIALRTSKDDRIFVWGTEPAIYSLSKRLPVGRYTVAYHIVDFDGYEEVYNAMISRLPKYVVTFDNVGEFKKLNGLLASEYLPVKQVADGTIFLKLTQSR